MFQVEDEQHGIDDTHWTFRRIALTCWYGVLGVIVAGLLGLVDMFFVASVYHTRDDWVFFAGMMALPLSICGAYRGAYGTCRANPVAPLGVSIGLFLGAQIYTVLLLANGWLVWEGAGTLILGLCFALAGYYGGKRGVRRRFGLPQLGVGIVCAHCGYDLSATPAHAVCPECGGHYRYAAMPPQ